MVPFDSLTDSVGPKAPNRPVDVAVVQDMIALAKTGKPGDCVNGLATDALFDDIGAYQTATFSTLKPDRTVGVDGRAFAALLVAAGRGYKGPLIFQQDPLGPWNLLDRTRFADLFARQFRRLVRYDWTTPSPPGLGTVLGRIVADQAVGDLRWAANMMATVQRETPTFLPREEGGKGAGKDYGKAVVYTAKDGKKYTNTYYGRGYVQLTFLENYVKLGNALALGEALAIDPARALEPDIAYNVMSYGMRNGSFTTRKLSEYIAGARCDYREARRIINGEDKAREIAACSAMIEGLLWLSTKACVGASAPMALGAQSR